MNVVQSLHVMMRTSGILVLCFALVEVPLSQHANAGMIPTASVVSEIALLQDRLTVQAYLNRAEVKQEFVKLGVSPTEATLRVASLSNREVQELAGQIDQGRVGGDALVISLTTILLIVLIVVLLGRV